MTERMKYFIFEINMININYNACNRNFSFGKNVLIYLIGFKV